MPKLAFKLNTCLFSSMDYAVVAAMTSGDSGLGTGDYRRPPTPGGVGGSNPVPRAVLV